MEIKNPARGRRLMGRGGAKHMMVYPPRISVQLFVRASLHRYGRQTLTMKALKELNRWASSKRFSEYLPDGQNSVKKSLKGFQST